MADEWADQDWQARADTGRDLGGRHLAPARCHLRNDWRDWSSEKRADRLFMSCPSCGKYGSHIEEA